MMRTLFAVLVALVALVVARGADARPVVALEASPTRAPLLLAPRDGGYAGDFIVRNAGDTPLIVSQIAIAGDEASRASSRVTVRFAEGPPSAATLGPGESRRAIVRWMPERASRLRVLVGQVIVTSNDEAAREAALGFRATLPRAIPLAHLLSAMIALPLVGALLSLAMRTKPPSARAAVNIGAGALAFALAAIAALEVSPELLRAQGNDALALIERVTLVRALGIEYFVALDGPTAAYALIAALVTLASLVDAHARGEGSAVRDAARLVALAAAIGALASRDLALAALFVAVLVAAFVALARAAPSRRSGEIAAKLALFGALGLGAFAVAVGALRASSPAGFLFDGTRVAHTFAATAIARASTGATSSSTHVVAASSAVALMLALSAAPLHLATLGAASRLPARTLAPVVALPPLAGAALFARVAFVCAPDAGRTLSPALAALGTLAIAYGSLCALAEREPRRFVAYASVANGGAAMLGFASLTAQGIAGALAQIAAASIAAGAAYVVLAARAPSRRIFAAAALAIGCAPLFACSWGATLAVSGAFALHPRLALVAALALAVLAAASVRLARDALRAAPLRAAGRADAAAIALIAIVLALGVYPRLVNGYLSGAVHDMTESLGAASPDPVAPSR